jgi:uncharacterized protein (TIGR03437 family)
MFNKAMRRISSLIIASCMAAVTARLMPAQPIMTTKAGTDWIFPGNGSPAPSAPFGKIYAVTVDKNDVLYFSDYDSQMVMRLNGDGTVTVVAGNGFQFNSGDGGPATHAGVFNPQGLAFDAAGDLYVAESYQHRIRKISGGVITTYAGSVQGFTGDGGPAADSRLNYPTGVAIDSSGALYFADTQNGRIRRIGADGIITTVAGNGKSGYDGDNNSAINAMLNSPEGVAVDASGNLYIADTLNDRIRKVDASGKITTVAGNGPGYSGDNGPASRAQLARPKEMFFDKTGNLYIADSANLVIRKIDTNGIISTIAGSAAAGFSGDGGTALKATLGAPNGVAVDSHGNIYIADTLNLRVRKVSPDGTISTVCGNGKFRNAPDNTLAINAFLLQPEDVAIDAKGNLLIADTQTNRVAKVTPDGIMTTFAGTGQYGFGGDGGPATKAFLTAPRGLAVATDGTVYIIDSENFRIRKVSPDGTIMTIAGTGVPGSTGDNGPANKSQLQSPRGLALDQKGNLYIADQGCHCIRVIDSAGIIRTIAGTGRPGYSGDNGAATAAQFNLPQKMAVDGSGNLYIADVNNNRIRRIDPSGRITTYAGNGTLGPGGNSGPAVNADIAAPLGVAVDTAGNLYVSAYYYGVVHKITPAGQISLVAGNRQTGFSGDGGPGPQASLWIPNGLITDTRGNVYIADEYNNRVRVLLASPPSFQVSTSALQFSASSTGARTDRQSVGITSSLTGLGFTVAAKTDDGANWLVVDTTSAAAPATFDVYMDPTNLPAGSYTGQLTITAPGAVPQSAIVKITGTVQAPPTAHLSIPNRSVNLTAVQNGPEVESLIGIQNTGGGSLQFTASTAASWLTLGTSSGTTAPNTPYPLVLTASPDDLAPGTYTEFVSIQADSGERLAVPVNLTVTQSKPVIVLSGSGLHFQALVGGGKLPSESIAILNAGVGQMSWTAETRTLAGGPSWLILSATSGTVVTPYLDSSAIAVTVDPTGLPVGDYYGQIKIRAAADNSPQSVTVVLSVLGTDTRPAPEIRPTGLLFSGAPGANPSSQDITVFNPGTTAINLSSGKRTSAGVGWLNYGPSNVTIPPGQSVRITVQPDYSRSGPGILSGSISLQFDDGSSQAVDVIGVINAPLISNSMARARPAVATCLSAVKMQAVQNKLKATIGQPVVIQVTLVDTCQQPVTNASGANAHIGILFDNNDTGGSMTYGNGVWSKSWIPQNLRSTITASVTAIVQFSSNPYDLVGDQVFIPITVSAATTSAPVIASGTVAHAASLEPGIPVSPGQVITLRGSNLSGSPVSMRDAPIPTQVGDLSVSLGDVSMPITSAANDRINLMVPFDSTVNSQHQIVIQRGTALSMPEPVPLRPTQPGIYTADGSGSGQGLILNDSAGAIADVNNPVSSGQTVTIMCTGLGDVVPALITGMAPNERAQSVAPVTVSIGGQEATVMFAGLTPDSAFIYRVVAKLPDAVPSGSEVPVMIAAGSVSSPPVTIAVR